MNSILAGFGFIVAIFIFIYIGTKLATWAFFKTKKQFQDKEEN